MRDERRHAVVLGDVAVGLHGVEEARDVPDLRLALGARLLREPREQPRPLQEAVQHLAGAPPRHLAGRALDVGDQPLGRRARAARDRGELLVRGKLAQHLEQRPRLAPRVVVEAQQVGLGQAVELRPREVEERHRVVRVREHLQERDQQPDLLARVEPAAAAEAVRHAAHVERAQEGIGVGVAAHQDREVARAAALREALVDLRGDGVGLRRNRVEGAVAHGRAVRPRRAQALVDPEARLQPVRVVVADEPRGRVEDHLRRAVVLGQHHLARPRVVAAEREQVGGGRAAPAVDRLVVVADHGQVAGRRRRAAPASRAGRGSCPGTRRPGCSGSARAARRARPCARAAARACGAIWSPKSTSPASPSRRWCAS